MNQNLARNSRSQSTLVIPTATKLKLYVGGDYFFIYSQSGALAISVNGDVFSNCQSGLIHSGVAGRNDIADVELYNTSGATVTVVIIFGKGSQSVTGTTTISAQDLAVITPAAATVQVDVETVTNASQVFSGKTSIAVVNTGAADITVNTRSLGAGESVEWSSLRQQDVLQAITVNATGSVAKVVWTA